MGADWYESIAVLGYEVYKGRIWRTLEHKYHSLLYIKVVKKEIKNICKKYGINVYYINSNSIHSRLEYVDDPLEVETTIMIGYNINGKPISEITEKINKLPSYVQEIREHLTSITKDGKDIISNDMQMLSGIDWKHEFVLSTEEYKKYIENIETILKVSHDNLADINSDEKYYEYEDEDYDW